MSLLCMKARFTCVITCLYYPPCAVLYIKLHASTNSYCGPSNRNIDMNLTLSDSLALNRSENIRINIILTERGEH